MINIPQTLRVAQKDDFYKKNKPNIGLPFYVYPFHHERLEEYIVKDNFNLEKWLPWLNEGRIYVNKSVTNKTDTSNLTHF